MEQRAGVNLRLFAFSRALREEDKDMKIHVGNLAYNVTEDDLRSLFSSFGEVSSVNIVKERSSGQSKGFGFVEMMNNSEADKAMKGLNGSRVKEQAIKLSQAKPPSKRPMRGFRD
jgi:RNA recognition motif-containing protein